MQAQIDGTTMPITTREESRAARRALAKASHEWVWVTDSDGQTVGKLHAAAPAELAAWDASDTDRPTKKKRTRKR